MAADLYDVVAPVAPAPGAPEAEPSELVLRLHVQPGAGRAAVVGRYGDALGVRVAPPPADGRANAAVVELLADVLGVKQAQLELVGGERSRQKRVALREIDVAAMDRRLDEAIAEAATTLGRSRRPGR